jgi:hypothetical protein
LIAFGVCPAFDGYLAECRAWAREAAAKSNLPVIEVPGVNRDLADLDFEAPAIYIRAIQFDELDPAETRIFRRW